MCLDAKGVNIALGRYGFANDGSAGDTTPTPRHFLPIPKVFFGCLGDIGDEMHTQFKGCCIKFLLDGRNPAPVDVVKMPLLGGFHTCQLVSQISSINSIISGSTLPRIR